jgi:ATP-dependent DNA helicase RecQ
LFFGASDLRTADFLIAQKVDPATGEPLENEQRVARHQLRQVLNYVESSECRRAIQLQYFDEAWSGACGSCDNCCEPRNRSDWSVEARQFLSCIARLAQRSERFGASYIIDILRGARTEKLLSRGHDTLSVYGIGKHRSALEWRALARTLVHQRLVEQSQDGYSVLRLNESSWQVLKSEKTVSVAISPKPGRTQSPRHTDRSATAAERALGADTAANDALFETLRVLRKQLADAQGLPPYVIFHDAALREMVAKRPQSLDQFAAIRGVGEGKLARYGEQFIAALRHASA